MAAGRTVAKDFYRLQKNIATFTNNEAKITEFDDDLTYFNIALNIEDGFYKNAIFYVKIQLGPYPTEAPEVSFLTEIYHPNIGDGFDKGTVCFSLLSEDWTGNNDLEDVVHGLLYLVKNPTFGDPLNPIYSGEEGDEFQGNVSISLAGGYLEGHDFSTNPGFILAKNTNATATDDKANDQGRTDKTTNDENPAEGETIGTMITNETALERTMANALALNINTQNSNITVDIIEMPGNEWRFLNILSNNVIYSGGNHERSIIPNKNLLQNNWLLYLLTILRTKQNSKDVRDNFQGQCFSGLSQAMQLLRKISPMA